MRYWKENLQDGHWGTTWCSAGSTCVNIWAYPGEGKAVRDSGSPTENDRAISLLKKVGKKAKEEDESARSE